jgi:scyllo-inositol 2-dehydrogenase (NADP+)
VSSSRIRTGLIGFGLSGRVFHAPFLATNPAFELSIIATGDPERRAAAAAAHPAARIVASPGELLAAELDLVVLASPVHAHAEQAGTALGSGRAVVVDKPFVPTVSEGRRLIDLAERSGVPLMVFQNRRWDGDFLTVRRLLAEGRLGVVHRFESTFERWGGALRARWQDRLGPETGAGIAYDLGSHLVDQSLQLFGAATVESAEFARVRESSVSEDDAFISLLHASGTRSHLTMSRVAGLSGPRFRVLGAESAYRVYGLDPQEAQLRTGVWPGSAGYGIAARSDWGTLGRQDDLVAVETEAGDYPAFYAGVAATLRDGAPVPVDARDALETIRIVERAHALARTGDPV